jgi:hypothetical protein
MEQPTLNFQRVRCQALACLTGGASRGHSRSVEDPVVTGAEESVVLGFPSHLAPQVGAGAGQGDEIVDAPIPSLPGNVDGLSRGTSVKDGFSGLHPVGFRNELPGDVGLTGRVEISKGNGTQSSIPADQAGSHGSAGRLAQEIPPVLTTSSFLPRGV